VHYRDLGLPIVDLVLVLASGWLILEGLVTTIALEELCLRMKHDMSVHPLAVLEGLMAHFALVDEVVLGVIHPHVVHHVRLGLEDFAAL